LNEAPPVSSSSVVVGPNYISTPTPERTAESLNELRIHHRDRGRTGTIMSVETTA